MTGDLVKERAHLFLGSRLKRLAERMQGDVVKVAERAGWRSNPASIPCWRLWTGTGRRPSET